MKEKAKTIIGYIRAFMTLDNSKLIEVREFLAEGGSEQIWMLGGIAKFD